MTGQTGSLVYLQSVICSVSERNEKVIITEINKIGQITFAISDLIIIISNNIYNIRQYNYHSMVYSWSFDLLLNLRRLK